MIDLFIDVLCLSFQLSINKSSVDDRRHFWETFAHPPCPHKSRLFKGFRPMFDPWQPFQCYHVFPTERFSPAVTVLCKVGAAGSLLISDRVSCFTCASADRGWEKSCISPQERLDSVILHCDSLSPCTLPLWEINASDGLTCSWEYCRVPCCSPSSTTQKKRAKIHLLKELCNMLSHPNVDDDLPRVYEGLPLKKSWVGLFHTNIIFFLSL